MYLSDLEKSILDSGCFRKVMPRPKQPIIYELVGTKFVCVLKTNFEKDKLQLTWHERDNLVILIPFRNVIESIPSEISRCLIFNLDYFINLEKV